MIQETGPLGPSAPALPSSHKLNRAAKCRAGTTHTTRILRRTAPAMGPGGRPQPWQRTDSTGYRRASPPSYKEQKYKAEQLDFGAPVKMPQKVFMCSLCCALIPKT